MGKEKVYVFKASLKNRKRIWRRIEIKGNQNLGKFDGMIRLAFDYDTFDHLSEFFMCKAFKSGGYGYIEPGGYGEGARKKIDSLNLTEGEYLEYIYDFGDNIQHIITLEQIIDSKPGIQYPRITDENKPRYQYCKSCKKQGKKTVAKWICVECSEEACQNIPLCNRCMEKDHEDHFIDEILY
ncbi:MAG: hypothetical protein R6U21_01595 [Thermoplasmatota archaeon]